MSSPTPAPHWPVLAAVCLSALGARAATTDLTPYGRACLRIESRPKPWEVRDAAYRAARENALAKAGAEARWIQVCDNEGNPLLKNPWLPCPYSDKQTAEHEAILKQWVKEIHDAGMAAMSWYVMYACREGWKQRPDWRQVSILPWPNDHVRTHSVCFNSGYGEALVNYCNFAIERIGLDGIWFDGAVWSEIWVKPLPLTCRCAACRAKFHKATGRDIPAAVDFADATFRRWLRWRTEQFGGFIGRIAKSIRTRHPGAAVAINHYHRPGVPWHSAIPLDRYDADIISGSEAFSPDRLDLTVRLCRAYGRPQAEVWRPFESPGSPEASAEPLLQHALICYAAGGQPSFGGSFFDPKMPPTAALMSPIMKAVQPHAGGPSLPYAALHVSQQTETFHFGRAMLGTSLRDPFFNSLLAWTTGLGKEHVPPDYIYDSDFTLPTLRRYKVVWMPLSQALSDAQAKAAIQYASGGGTAVLGVGAGELDEEAQPRGASGNLLSEALKFRWYGVPDPMVPEAETHKLVPTQGGASIAVSGLFSRLTVTRSVGWQILYTEPGSPEPAVVATRRFGKGRVVVLNVDPVRTFGSTPAAGGKTQLAVTDEQAASGKYSLKYVEHPIAPQPFHPDLENKVAVFGAPEFIGGVLTCDLRVGKGAAVSIEIRSTTSPIHGPMAHVDAQGRLHSLRGVLCQFPLDQWVKLRIAYDFAREGKPSAYELTAALPGGKTHAVRAPCRDKGYRQTDWFVVFGPGRTPSVFYLDNLRLERVRADGKRETVLFHDFEGGPAAFAEPTALVRRLAELTKQYARPPIGVEAPPSVRVGFFARGDGRILVHLHDRDALRRDWQHSVGAAVTLRTAFPVTSARLAIPGTHLSIARSPLGGWHSAVRVPPIGLYQVLELRR